MEPDSDSDTIKINHLQCVLSQYSSTIQPHSPALLISDKNLPCMNRLLRKKDCLEIFNYYNIAIQKDLQQIHLNIRVMRLLKRSLYLFTRRKRSSRKSFYSLDVLKNYINVVQKSTDSSLNHIEYLIEAQSNILSHVKQIT